MKWNGIFALVTAVLLLGAAPAESQTLNIVALGASNTEGKGRGKTDLGVSKQEAFPAQLEKLLKAKGFDARVKNAGVAGDTTADMLKRLDRDIPKNTRIVILQPGGNDVRQGGSGAGRDKNIAEITRRLEARGVHVILLERFGQGIGKHRLADHQHFSADGHAAVAARLLPDVIAVAGKK